MENMEANSDKSPSQSESTSKEKIPMTLEVERIRVPKPTKFLQAIYDEIKKGLALSSPMYGEHMRCRMDAALGRMRSILRQLQLYPRFLSEEAQKFVPELLPLAVKINELLKSHVSFARASKFGQDYELVVSDFSCAMDDIENDMRKVLRSLYLIVWGEPDTQPDTCWRVCCNVPMPDMESVFPTLPTVFVGREGIEKDIVDAVRSGHGECTIEEHVCHQQPVSIPSVLKLTAVDEEETDVLFVANPVPMGVPRLILISGPGGIGKSALALRVARTLSGEFPDGDFYVELHSKRETGLPVTAAMLIILRQHYGVGYIPPAREQDIASSYRDLFVGKRTLMVIEDPPDAETVRALLPYKSDCCVIITSRLSLKEDLDADAKNCILVSSELGPIDDESAARYLRATVPQFKKGYEARPEWDDRHASVSEISLFTVPDTPLELSGVPVPTSGSRPSNLSINVPESPEPQILTLQPATSPTVSPCPSEDGEDEASEISSRVPLSGRDREFSSLSFDYHVVRVAKEGETDAALEMLNNVVESCCGNPLALQLAAGYLRRNACIDGSPVLAMVQRILRTKLKHGDPVMSMFAASFNQLNDAAQRMFLATSVFPTFFENDDAIAIAHGEETSAAQRSSSYCLPVRQQQQIKPLTATGPSSPEASRISDLDQELSSNQTPSMKTEMPEFDYEREEAEVFDILLRSGLLRADSSHCCGVRYRHHDRLRKWCSKKLSEWGDQVPWRIRFWTKTLDSLAKAQNLYSRPVPAKKEGFALCAGELVNFMALRAMSRHKKYVRMFGAKFQDSDVLCKAVPVSCRLTLLSRIVSGLPREQVLFPVEEVTILLALGNAFLESSQLQDAEPLLKRVVRTCKASDDVLGDKSLLTACGCNNLAAVLHELGQYDEAEPLYQQALSIRKSLRGESSPDVAETYNNLGVLAFERGSYTKADEYLKQALKAREEIFGKNSLWVAGTLNNLALLYKLKGRVTEAEPLFLRALQIQMDVLGSENIAVGSTANMLGELYSMLDRYDDAIDYFRKAQKIQEAAAAQSGQGLENLSVTLHNLATVMDEQGIYKRAEVLAKQSLKMKNSALGMRHHSTAKTLNLLAGIYRTEGKYDLAEPMYKLALGIREQTLGPMHADVATTLYNYAALLTNMKRYDQAEPMYQRALHVCEVVLSPQHPRVATTLNHLGKLYAAQKKWNLAEEHYDRALMFQEETLGTNHPDLAATLNNAAVMHKARGNVEESERLYRRALIIHETSLGQNHPNVAVTLNNLASLCYSQAKYSDAEEMLVRAIDIYSERLSRNHPTTLSMIASLARVRKKAVKMRTDEEEERVSSENIDTKNTEVASKQEKEVPPAKGIRGLLSRWTDSGGSS